MPPPVGLISSKQPVLGAAEGTHHLQHWRYISHSSAITNYSLNSYPNFKAKKIPAVLGYEIKQDHEEVNVYSGEVLQ